MRKLASIQKIVDIRPIPDADAIEVARVLNWDVVVKKGEYGVGDMVVYLEIDSWVPETLAPFLIKGKTADVYQGVAGAKLKTIRLRGQVSQGLILPIPFGYDRVEGADLTEALGILKWERPDSTGPSAPKGNFPGVIIKTDQERIQNLGRELVKFSEYTWEVTEKLEGSSMTVYLIDGEFGVCSRNLDLKEVEGNHFWAVARKLNLEEKLRSYHIGENIAIQGELIGPGVQDNIYGLTNHRFMVFDIQYPSSGMTYATPDMRRALCATYGLEHVPVIDEEFKIDSLENFQDKMLAMADGMSILPGFKPVLREGLVFKANAMERLSWKAVSNKYLLKQKD